MRSMDFSKGFLLVRLAVLALAIISLECKKDSSSPSGPDSGGPTGSITTGSSVSAGSGIIGNGGGSFTIMKPGTPIDGLQVNFPANAYPEPRTVEISYQPILGHQLGTNFNPLTPLISISNGGGYSQGIITVKIPVKVPAGHFAMGFLYDDETGELEGLPMVACDSSSLTIATRNFAYSSASSGFPKTFSFASLKRSKIVISSISELNLNPSQDTRFRPGVDDWGFKNLGSYLAPKGQCAGQSIGAMWYYKEKRLKGSAPLWFRFDNNGDDPKTPKVWQDDALAYRFCGVLQKDAGWENLADVIAMVFQLNPVGDSVTWRLFMYSLLLTKKPQMVGMFGREGLKPAGHAMIIYGLAGNQLYVCDPNYPGDLGRRITKGFFEFDPYYEGATGTTEGLAYNHIFYQATTSLIEWNSIDSRWKELLAKTIGNDAFPGYTIQVLNENAEFEPLVDGFTRADGHFTISVTGDGFSARFQAFDENQSSLGFNKAFDLTKGKHRLGICVYDDGYNWVGFNWFSVTAGGDTGLIPLAVENSWTYEQKEFNPDGTLLTTSQRVTTVTKDTLADAQRWFVVSETEGGHTATVYMANRADGVWYWFPTSPLLKTFLAYKYPARPGETFQSGIDGKTTVTLKDTSASTNTPSGTFSHCYLYESKTEGRTDVTQVWISPGLGPVAETDLKPYPGGGTYIAMRKGLTTYILH